MGESGNIFRNSILIGFNNVRAEFDQAITSK